MMPGLAASPFIFEYIELPKDQFKIHWLEWLIPEQQETIEHYAQRMVTLIKESHVVLLGVSFGGILVQEMSRFLKVRKLIVVSSVKSYHELPKRLKVLRYTKAYKILPTQLLSNIDLLAKFSLGNTISKRIDLYKKYLSVTDKTYLDWSIEQVVNWQQEEPIEHAIYIHGDNDVVFPHSCMGNCVVVKGGSHIMIINKYKWFNENLPKLILS